MIAYWIAGGLVIIGVIIMAVAKANDGAEAYGALTAFVFGALVAIIGALVALARYLWGVLA